MNWRDVLNIIGLTLVFAISCYGKICIYAEGGADPNEAIIFGLLWVGVRVGFVWGVYALAKGKNRMAWAWAWVATFIAPLIVLIVVAFVKSKPGEVPTTIDSTYEELRAAEELQEA